MTIPKNQYQLEATFSATSDAGGEGWKSHLRAGCERAGSYRNSFMTFIRDNV